jgi:putative chitinase
VPQRPLTKNRPLSLEKLESREVFAGVAFTVVGQVGSTVGALGPLSSLSSDISINDAGQLAFTGTVATGSTIVAGAAANNLKSLSTPGNVDTAMIANTGEVSARQILPGAVYAIRKWQIATPGSFTNVVIEQSGGSVSNPSISNDGTQVAYFYRPPSSTSGFLTLNGVQRGGPFSPGVALIKPSVNNRGDIVTRGSAATDPLALYPAGGTKVTIAAAPEFTALGTAPSISDDGSLIVFQGTLSDTGATTLNATLPAGMAKLQGGEGIFAAVLVGTSWHIQRVAGVSGNGRLDPGEVGDKDNDGIIGAGEVDSGPVKTFDVGSRVGITGSGNSFDVVFAGGDNGAVPTIYGDHVTLDASKRVRAFAVPIVKTTDSIPGLSFAPKSFRLSDPINSKGQIAFAAIDTTGAQVAAVRAKDPWLLHNKSSAGTFSLTEFAKQYKKAFRETLSSAQTAAVGQLLGYIQNDTAVRDLRWISYMFATVKRETGSYQAIEEKPVLNKLYKLRKTADPYFATSAEDYFNHWYQNINGNGDYDSNDGYTFRGRGYVQLTGRANYQKLGTALGIDLVNDPGQALDSQTAYNIMSHGMRNGSFKTGEKFSKYFNATTTDYYNARRIINGTDRAVLIAGYAEAFEAILARSAI